MRLLILMLFALFIVTAADAAVFTVTPTSDADCSDYSCDLQSALTAAASNGQSDTLNLSAGTYALSSTLTYLPASNENFSLTIVGAGYGNTIISGGSNAHILSLDATGVQGSQTDITLLQLTITGSGDVRIATNGGNLSLPEINSGAVTAGGRDIKFSTDVTADAISLTNSSVAVSANAGTGRSNVAVCSESSCENGLPVVGAGSQLTIKGETGPVSLTPIADGQTVSLTQATVPPSRPVLDNVSTVSISPGSSEGAITVGTGTMNGGTVSVTALSAPAKGITAAGGTTVVLDPGLTEDEVTNQGWTQLMGQGVILSDSMSLRPTFVAPSAQSGSPPVFEHKAVRRSDNKLISTYFSVTMTDNGITGFPDAAVTFKSASNENMGLRVTNGTITGLVPVTPATLANTSNQPSDMPYGVLDLQLKVNNPGDTATVTLYLPAPAPPGYKWYKYNSRRGWYDFSDHAQFNGDRTQITLTLTDGGIGDDDGIANGVIKDPSGLGSEPAAASGKGGCFIATAAFGSALDPCVSILRSFRDKYMLTNFVGRRFVAMYYRYSPPIADFIAQHDFLKFIVRLLLLPAIALSWLSLKSPVIALAVVVTLGSAPLCLLHYLKKHSAKEV